MHIINYSYYKNLYKELGLINSIKYTVYRRIFPSLRYKNVRNKNGGKWKLRIKSLGRDVSIRPNTTDFELIGEFFLNGAVGGNAVFQYNIDYSDKIEEDVKYIIDAGANIGLFSVLYNKKFPNALIAAIEPEKENFDMLAINTANISNIKLFRGVWNKDCYLKVEQSKTGAWGFTVRECDKINADVDAYSIISIMKHCKFPHIDILKIDIEGSEFFVFNDEQCFEWLRKTKCLIIECHDKKNARMLGNCK